MGWMSSRKWAWSLSSPLGDLPSNWPMALAVDNVEEARNPHNNATASLSYHSQASMCARTPRLHRDNSYPVTVQLGKQVPNRYSKLPPASCGNCVGEEWHEYCQFQQIFRRPTFRKPDSGLVSASAYKSRLSTICMPRRCQT